MLSENQEFWLQCPANTSADFSALDAVVLNARKKDICGQGSRPKKGIPGRDLMGLGKRREQGVAWKCGDFWEISILAEQFVTGFSPENGESRNCDPKERKKREQDYVAKAAYRAMRSVRRLCNTANVRYMWSLSFAVENSPKNKRQYRILPLDKQRDYDAIRRCWKSFVQKLRRKGHYFRWIVVFELHDSPKTSDIKRGTWHIHFATPEFLPAAELWDLWQYGSVDFQDFSKPKKEAAYQREAVRNPGAYMSKYVGKNFSESNAHKKRYSTSRDFPHPKKYSLEEFLCLAKDAEWKEVFSTTRKSVEGNVVGESFTLKRA